MYLRFVVDEKNPSSQKRLGIFHALRYLRDDGELSVEELDLMNQVMDWFAIHLNTPDIFTHSNRNRSDPKAVSWFKDTANGHISNFRKIVAVLKAHGQNVEMITTDRPGYIVYEDDHQIVAKPFAETET